MRELDVLGRPQRDALQRLAEGTIPQTESSIAVQGGASKLVVVAGQPIEVAEQPCMLFTFNDLEPRRSGTALRHSEQRFATVSSAGAGADDAEHGGRPAAGSTTPSSPPPATTPRRCRATRTHWRGCGPIRAPDRAMACWSRAPACAAGAAREALLDCLLSAAPVNIQDLPCVLGAIQDITERKRNELELMEAIETVMQDTSWFSRTVIELAQIRAPGAPQSQASWPT